MLAALPASGSSALAPQKRLFRSLRARSSLTARFCSAAKSLATSRYRWRIAVRAADGARATSTAMASRTSPSSLRSASMDDVSRASSEADEPALTRLTRSGSARSSSASRYRARDRSFSQSIVSAAMEKPLDESRSARTTALVGRR